MLTSVSPDFISDKPYLQVPIEICVSNARRGVAFVHHLNLESPKQHYVTQPGTTPKLNTIRLYWFQGLFI